MTTLERKIELSQMPVDELVVLVISREAQISLLKAELNEKDMLIMQLRNQLFHLEHPIIKTTGFSTIDEIEKWSRLNGECEL